MVHSIHPRTVQEVKEKADIVDVISEHIVLKKKNTNNDLFVIGQNEIRIYLISQKNYF